VIGVAAMRVQRSSSRVGSEGVKRRKVVSESYRGKRKASIQRGRGGGNYKEYTREDESLSKTAEGKRICNLKGVRRGTKKEGAGGNAGSSAVNSREIWLKSVNDLGFDDSSVGKS